MAESEQLNLPNSIVEQLRCSLCNGYLSCAPIQLLSDGRSICGHCCPSVHDGPTYRQIAFEAVLAKTSFPCQFKERGCEELILFGHVAEHEDSCPYRPSLCPFLPNGACLWKGSMNQIPDHFKHDHPAVVMQKIEFKIEVDHDGQGILLAIIEDVAFISKFVYCANKRSLLYDIRSLGININSAHYNIRLTNNIVCAFSVSLKGDNCLPYNNLFHDMDNAKDLNIVNFLPILDNPNEITFAMDVVVPKSEHLNSSETENQVHDFDRGDVNNISNLNDAQIKQQESSKAISPCSWEDCTFVGTPEEIPEHEMLCKFRLCGCTAKDCSVKFKPEAILTHLMSHHGFHYITDELDLKMVFSEADETRAIFSLKFNGVIYIVHEAKRTDSSFHEIILRCYGTPFNKQTNRVSCVIEIEHPNCKYKSKVFILFPGRYCMYTHCLPDYIKRNDQFSVTVKIF